jgi:DNA-binding transcriptional MocR family regulator
MDWLPTLSEGSGPVYRRIVEALSNDIASGRLKRGEQLPTHRALAQALKIDLTTVTRAYGEARRGGLLDARVGQGTFVSETTARATVDLPHPVKIDLSMNVPPQPIEANLDIRIAQGLASIQKEAGFSTLLNYQRPRGGDEDRDTAANWLRVRVPKAQADRLVIFPGSQSAIFNVLLSLASPGDVVLTETLTYPGVKAAAGGLGVRLVSVTMDEQGYPAGSAWQRVQAA